MNKSNESGSVMVEATIYFPIVILVVAFLLCVGIAKLQSVILWHDVTKISREASLETQLNGYEKLVGKSGRMSADMEEFPKEKKVKEYYTASIDPLYIEQLNRKEIEDAASKKMSGWMEGLQFVAGGMTESKVDVSGILVPKVEVSVNYKIDFPLMFGYLTGDKNDFKDVTLGAYSRTVAIHSTEFVRNVDITYDLIKFLAEKLGFSAKINGAVSKFKELKEKIL